VSREVYPFGGGGIGQYVAAAANLLTEIAEVTVVTTSLFEDEFERLRAARDPRLAAGVRYSFVPEPSDEEAAPWTHVMHCYGARVFERLKELYPNGGPELIEFPDFLGEAFVTLQAAETFDSFLADTSICVRIHTTAEICEVLDGHFKLDRGSKALHAMERYSLEHADRLIWQGGDVLGTYQRYYGASSLGRSIRIRYPYSGPAVDGGADAGYEPGTPLRILYAGRLERRKGVHNLVRAMTELERGDVHLTLLGADTPTAPLGVSMRELLELAIADDPRIELRPATDRAAVAQTIREHDVVAVPSLWECWPYAALEPLHLNRPVLATPVGGLVELVRPDRSGWLANGTDHIELEALLQQLADQRPELERMIQTQTPLSGGRELADAREITGAYEALAAAGGRRRGGSRHPSRVPPLVSAIVPYYRAAPYVRDTIESLLAQTYDRIEIVIVNDGSFDDEDWILAELTARHPVRVVTQMNQGLGAARNFAIQQTTGRYVFPLDADNCAEPEFVARSVEVLERRPEVAFVTSWSRYINAAGVPREGHDIGYEPLGNHAELNAEENVAGDAAAVLRRRLFDSGFRYSEEIASFEDWHLYRELQRAGHFGAVIPERLLRYRTRDDSMQAEIAQPRRARLIEEIEALIRENGTRWTSLNV
jgi:glycogen(starch) synthase